MKPDDAMTEPQAELWEWIEAVRVAMMATVDADGSLRSRPMWTQGDRFDGTLWFFVSEESPTAEALSRDPRIVLGYGAPSKDLFVSVTGRATLVHDRAKAEEMWNPYAEAWFPGGGIDDPHLALVRIDVEQAEYWEDKKPKLLQFAEVLVGAVTANPPKSGEQKKLSFGDS